LSLHHFSFGAPHDLFALLVVPLLFVYTAAVRRRRSRFSVAFTNLDVLADVSAKRHARSRWWLRLPLILFALALTTAAAALAQPRIQLTASDRSATIILLADVSQSMEAVDISPSRLDAAVAAMHQLVDELPASDKVGLVTFSDRVEVIAPPTPNHTAIDSGLDVLTPQGGTALGAGIEAAVKIVVSTLAASGVYHTAGEYLPAAIVLESDGAQDRGTISPFAAGELAKAAGVRIYGIALGKPYAYITEGTGYYVLKIPVPPDPGTVGLLARLSGGQAFSATTATSLDTIYRKLGLTIGRRPQLTAITSWFALAAAILLVSAVGAARARGGALP
jgi:Ca-activated chloride channel family protein